MIKIILFKNQLVRLIFIACIGMVCTAQAYALKPNHEIIVLVHGLMRTSLSMKPLKSYLERQGYIVYSYNYPSTKYTIAEHGLYLKQFINKVLAKNPDMKIHLITHSLGGIIAREALVTLKPTQLKKIGYLIMLAPPNQGSMMAKLLSKTFPLFTGSIKPLADLSSDQTSYVHRVPIPDIKMGIIAGRFDAKVPPAAARLQGQAEPVVINSTHTFIMNNARARQLILGFLEKGAFE